MYFYPSSSYFTFLRFKYNYYHFITNTLNIFSFKTEEKLNAQIQQQVCFIIRRLYYLKRIKFRRLIWPYFRHKNHFEKIKLNLKSSAVTKYTT
jgi:hypothetical protein